MIMGKSRFHPNRSQPSSETWSKAPRGTSSLSAFAYEELTAHAQRTLALNKNTGLDTGQYFKQDIDVHSDFRTR